MPENARASGVPALLPFRRLIRLHSAFKGAKDAAARHQPTSQDS